MSETRSLSAQPRDRVGKGASRAARREGLIPAVIYGGGKTPESIAIDLPQMIRALNQGKFMSTVFMVDVAGRQTRVIPKDIQFHPVSDVPQHIDFVRVGATETVTVAVAVHFENQDKSPGLKRGGVLNIVRHEVEIEAPVGTIPDHLTADLTGYDINDSLHISAMTLPDGVAPAIKDRDFTIATIAAPAGGAEAAEDEGGESEA
ncbi:MAG: 50S ribosomal protein L25/general stress protein Ctc [Alphaproteobacteria bacterium]